MIRAKNYETVSEFVKGWLKYSGLFFPDTVYCCSLQLVQWFSLSKHSWTGRHRNVFGNFSSSSCRTIFVNNIRTLLLPSMHLFFITILRMVHAKNYEAVSTSVKVMQKKPLPLFSGHGV